MGKHQRGKTEGYERYAVTGFFDEGMVEQVRPRQSTTGVLLQQALRGITGGKELNILWEEVN